VGFRNARFRYGDGIRNLFILPILAVAARLFVAISDQDGPRPRCGSAELEFHTEMPELYFWNFGRLRVYAAKAGFETFLASKSSSSCRQIVRATRNGKHAWPDESLILVLKERTDRSLRLKPFPVVRAGLIIFQDYFHPAVFVRLEHADG
jgi:hypothetical protein